MVRIEVPMDLGPTSLEIYDIAGKKVGQTTMRNGNQTLSVNEWARGIYTVIIQGEYGPVGRRRLVVK